MSAFSQIKARFRFGQYYLLSKLMTQSDREAVGERLFRSFGGVLIQNTGICNAKCVFCPYKLSKNSGQTMRDDVFDKAVQGFAQMGGGHFGFLPIQGEPTLDSSLLKRILRVRELACTRRISMTTNGILLDRFGLEELLRSGIDQISISTSGFDEEMYKRVYGSEQYHRMYNNVVNILKLNKKMREPVYIEIEIRSDHSKKETMKTKGFAEVEQLTKNIHFLTRYANWSGIVKRKDLHGTMKIKSKKLWLSGPCKMLLWSPMIFADGTVGACNCRDPYGSPALRIGNLFENTLEEIFLGTRRSRIFESFIKRHPPKICCECSQYVGWEVNLYNTYKSIIAER